MFWAGRITASKGKAICKIDKERSSQSLIKSISYPETNIFHLAATNRVWIRKKEQGMCF
jgi:hypothetical protein